LRPVGEKSTGISDIEAGGGGMAKSAFHRRSAWTKSGGKSFSSPETP
jgi:hypothetical protein